MVDRKRKSIVIALIGFLAVIETGYCMGRKGPDYRMGKLIHDLTAYDLKTKKSSSLAEPEHRRTGYTWLSPDGKWVIYTEQQKRNAPEQDDLYLVSVGGTKERHIVGGLGVNIDYLAWLPDSNGFTFTSYKYVDRKSVDYGLFRYDLGKSTGPVLIPIVKKGGLEFIKFVKWFPNGDGFVCVGTEHDRDTNLYRVSADGSSYQQIGDFPGVVMIDLSPDGKKIAMTWQEGLYFVDIDGTHLVQLRKPASYNLFWPVWSPDGQWILYKMMNVRGDYLGWYVINVETGRSRHVIDNVSDLQWWAPKK